MGVRLGARGFLGVHFWGLTHECRGRVEVNLQEIAERLFGAGGGTLVHTHFSLREISKTADRGGAGHPWARFPCCALTPLLWAVNDTEVQLLPIAALSGTRARDAGRQGPRRFLPAAGAVVLVLVLVPWCWSCGAGAVVLVLWCWCWCLRCGAGCCLPRGVHSFRVPGLVVSRMRCKGIRAPARGALPMPPAQAHKPRVVAALEVVLRFKRRLAD